MKNNHPRFAIPIIALLLLGGCGGKFASTDISDPYESKNRKVHDFNKYIDLKFKKKSSHPKARQIPNAIGYSVSNIARNLRAPSNSLNSFLQGKVDAGVGNLFQFIINSTLGIGGVFDVASSMGIKYRWTDFGETLYVWGVPEGAYIERPFVGGATTRDIAGSIGDIVISPWRVVSSYPLLFARIGFSIGDKIVDRDRYGQTIGAILYESTDSYAQMKNYIVSQRRYRIGQTQGQTNDDFLDPYAE